MLLHACPSFAGQPNYFIEFAELPAKKRVYDLRTVQMIQPGRFTILSTSIDDADVMAFELKLLDTLRGYCKRPDGTYPPPTNLFTLGKPDLTIKDIEVKGSEAKSGSTKRQYKSAEWYYPYKRLAIEDRGNFSEACLWFFCKDGLQTDEWQLYQKERTSITNGTRHKELFDCKRNLRGEFVTINDGSSQPDRFFPSDPAKVTMDPPIPHSYSDVWYRGVCRQVMHEEPYSPE